jgi:hypothetical protein
MPFDRQAEYQAQLDHLISLARLPDWKAYAWRRAKELEADESGLFRGLPDSLTAAMSKPGPACAPVSADQTTTKHP